MKELEWLQDFPHFNISVAIETRVLIQSSSKPNVVNPHPDDAPDEI